MARWLPRFGSAERACLSSCLSSEPLIVSAGIYPSDLETEPPVVAQLREYGSVFWDAFWARLRAFEESDGVKFKTEGAVCGLIFFSAAALIARRDGATVRQDCKCDLKESLITFTLLYMIVDDFLDSGEGTVGQIQEALKGNPQGRLVAAHRILERLKLVEVPGFGSLEAFLLAALRAEVEGMKIQEGGQWPRQAYLEAAERKGRETGKVIGAMSVAFMDIEDPADFIESAGGVGEIIQLIDDMLDAEADKAEGAHTIATCDLDAGSLDRLLCYTVGKIVGLSEVRDGLKPVLMAALAFVVSRRASFSSATRWYLREVTPFDYRLGFDPPVAAEPSEDYSDVELFLA